MRALPPLLTTFLLLAGSAQAAVVPVAADLTFREPPVLEGEVRFSSPVGRLDLTEVGADGSPFNLTWTSASGHLHHGTYKRVHFPGNYSANHVASHDKEPLSLGPGSLRDLRCAAECAVLVYGTGEGSEVGVSGVADGPLGRLDALRKYFAGDGTQDDRKFEMDVLRGTLAATAGSSRADALPLADATSHARGRVGLFIMGATFALHEGRVREIDTLVHHEVFTTPTGPATTDSHVRFLHLELEGAHVEAPSAGLFLATEGSLALDGVLRSPLVEGRMVVDGEERDLLNESAYLDGVLEGSFVTPTADVPASDLVSSLQRVRNGLSGEYGPSSMTLEGDARRVQVNGARVVEPPAPSSAGLVTGGVALAAALATLLLLLQRGGLAFLYSRISRSGVLDNPRRRQVYELLRERPGLTATELAERTGLARVVVQHHLRMLETHHLVTPRKEGRLRAFFLMGEAPTPDLLACHSVLRDDTRRRLAEALASSEGPITQATLAGATGLSQRLVSYHLAQLQNIGLVHTEGTLPRRYRPTDLLKEALKAFTGPAT